MGLLSTNITNLNKLSLKDVVLKAPKQKVEFITPLAVEKPPTNEEIIYSRLIALNPIIKELVERLDLVSIINGDTINNRGLTEVKPKIDKLTALAQKVIKGGTNYSKEEIIDSIKGFTNISQERAEIGFNLMLQEGVIETALGDSYYLIGATGL